MDRRAKETLMNAVVGGTLKDVQNAFDEHNLVFDESYFDYKLLQAGLRRRHQSILHFLINKIGCRAGNPNNVKAEETALHLAMKLNNESMIKKMLNRGALVFDKNDDGEIPLLAGFKNENFDAVRALLTHSQLNCGPDDENAILYFHIACVTNHITAAKHFLKCRINPNSPLSLDSAKYSGLNPVQYAAEKNYFRLFFSLVYHGGDLSIKNAEGLTPLQVIYYTSLTKDRKSRIQQIFEIGNNTKLINAVDNNGVSHFHLCCMLNELDYVQVFIDNGAKVNSSISLNCTVDAGFTPLHFAVISGCEKTVELLLKYGADCNKKDAEGRTPLHLAYQISGYWKAHIIKILLDYKASPVITDKEGCTPLHLEFLNANRENQNIFDMLFSKISSKINFTNNEGLSHFHIACATNNRTQVKNFLQSGIKVDSSVTSGTYAGYTALHFAALHNQIDVVKLLLKKNVQVNMKANETLVTPLHLACEFNYTKFREENPVYDLQNFKSFPIDLDIICNRTNQLDIIRLLLSHEAHVNAQDYQGNTPLLHMCKIDQNYCRFQWYCLWSWYSPESEKKNFKNEISIRIKEIVEILVSHKANMNIRSNNQKSILHIISEYSSLKIPENLIKLILTEGVDIDAVDDDGLTPVHVAVKATNKRMLQFLLKHKANVNIKCKKSEFPLHILFSAHPSCSKKYSIESDEKEIFCALLENGSNVNILGGKENKSPLHDAIYDRDMFIIERLLYYGADVNMEDASGNSCITPFFEWEREDVYDWLDNNYAAVFKIIYIHVQKLLALGLNVSKKIQKCCSQFYPHYKAALLKEELEGDDILKDLDNIFHDCNEELGKMKSIKIDNYTSLYSILLKNPHELPKHIRNKSLIKIIKAQNLNKDFPLYSYLLKLQFRTGLTRSYLLPSAKASLSNLINLPDLCYDLILENLKNEDIANLKNVAPVKRSLKRKLNDTTDSKETETLPKLQKEEENPRARRLNSRNSVSSKVKKARAI